MPASLFVHCVSAGACEGQKRVSDPLEPELGVGELPSVGAGNWAQILRKSSKCS